MRMHDGCQFVKTPLLPFGFSSFTSGKALNGANFRARTEEKGAGQKLENWKNCRAE
jgi:hypothetical protein